MARRYYSRGHTESVAAAAAASGVTASGDARDGPAAAGGGGWARGGKGTPAALLQAWARMEEKAGELERASAVYALAVSAYPLDAALAVEWGKVLLPLALCACVCARRGREPESDRDR